MGRPIKAIWIGERAGFETEGAGLASITVVTGSSLGYTTGDALTIGAPDLGGGVQAVATAVAGSLIGSLDGTTTYTTLTGTGVDGVGNPPTITAGVAQKSTSGVGVGAVFTITKDNTNAVVNYSDVSSIVVTAIGSGYVIGDTITVSGAGLGNPAGVDATNDLTFTIATFVTLGELTGATVTVAGSGYTSAPTVTAGTGTIGTGTLTAVLESSNEVIQSTAFLEGGSNLLSDMIIQKGNDTYRVTTADGTGECSLVNDTPAAAGEMAIIATDSAGGTYYVTKLYNNTVRLDPANGTGVQFALGDKVSWAKDGVAVLNYSVVIT